MNIKIQVAIIGAAASVLGAIVSLLTAVFVNRLARKREQELENKKSELQTALELRKTALQRELEEFKADLDSKKSERGALLDYRYEARKRLYTECEPLVFQLTESATEALYRIRSLARTARQGRLDEAHEHWLGHDGYYMLSTAYKLFAPVGVYKLLQSRLTLVDLGLDERIGTQYQLAKGLAYAWTDDFTFAAENPVLDYRPSSDGAQAEQNPRVCWRQGMSLGAVDNAAESLIVQTKGDIGRVLSFGAFSRGMADQVSSENMNFKGILGILRLFHPATRPVLWRILIAQAHILYALSNVTIEGDTTPPPRLQILPDTLRTELDWRPQDQPRDPQTDQPFEIAESYLQRRFPKLWTA